MHPNSNSTNQRTSRPPYTTIHDQSKWIKEWSIFSHKSQKHYREASGDFVGGDDKAGLDWSEVEAVEYVDVVEALQLSGGRGCALMDNST